MGQIIHDISNPNDGLGDELRTAFDHQNDMNTELYDTKVDKVLGKDLSSNDYDNAAVVKLAGIEAGAQVNVPINWNDIIGAPEELFASVGYFDHNDLATHTTALTYTSGVELQLTNDTLGAYTDISQAPYGVVDVWDASTNTFDFSALDIGDTLDLRVDLNVSTLTSNSTVKCFLRIAEGTANEFDVFIGSEYYKNAVTFENLKLEVGFYIGNLDAKNAPAKLTFLSTDTNGEVEVNGWYTRIIRKDVNFVSGGVPAEPLGKIRIVDKLGEVFTDLATASAYVSNFTLATLTNESFSDGVYYFTVPNGSSFAQLGNFLAPDINTTAYIEDTLGLISDFGNDAFYYNIGNNILGNCTFEINAFTFSSGNNIFGDCTFGEHSFQVSSGNNIFGNCTFGSSCFNTATGNNKFKNILLSAPTDGFGNSATGRFEIYGNIGTTEAANYTNFFASSNATIWADKSKETSNGGALEGDLATAQTNGSKLFFGYVPAGGGGASPTVAGISKLYDSLGSNTDGSINQDVITTQLNSINLNLSLVLENEILENGMVWQVPNINGSYGSGAGSSQYLRLFTPPVTQNSLSNTVDFGMSVGVLSTTTSAGGIACVRRNDSIALNRYEKVIAVRDFVVDGNISADCRYFTGFSKNFMFVAPTNIEPTLQTNCILVAKLSTSNNLHIVHNDNTGVATGIDLGVDFPANSPLYKYRMVLIRRNDSDYDIQVVRTTLSNGIILESSVYNLTTDLPLPGDQLQQIHFVTNNATAIDMRLGDYGLIIKKLPL